VPPVNNVSFAHYVALFDQFLIRRRDIVERVESQLLNVRGKDITRNRDRRHFEQLLNACFFDLLRLPPELAGLKGQLAARHVADGFAPIQADQYANELDPLQLIVYAYRYWEQHRWPGSSGRLTYAGTIYAVFFLRQLEYLSLRIWDDEDEQAGDRLRDVQVLLDRLNEPAGAFCLLQSPRSAVTGSTRAARHAGRVTATAATTPTRTRTAAIVTPSSGVTP
jgi:hypothetical protein